LRFLVLSLLYISLVFAQVNNSSEFSNFDDEFTVAKKDVALDPLKKYNIVMTNINDFIYMNVMGPVSKGYKKVVPAPARNGITNFFHNLAFPIRFVNNILQFKFKNSFEETARFVINSTFGIAGFNDIAYTKGGLKPHNEDFGQTLGFYGISNDIPITLPLLGQSNLRDTLGFVTDGFLDPLYYARNNQYGILNKDTSFIAVEGLKVINEYSLHVKEYESVRKDSLNLYILLQSIYEQHRNKLIKE
jgi:phospholipid-binding lipoprotein MlaA